MIDGDTLPTRTHPPRPPGKPRRHRVNLALAGVLLTQGMSYDEVAPRVGAATGNSLRVNLGKKGLNLDKMRNPDPAASAQAVATIKLVSEASEIVKERLHGRLGAQIEQLSKRKVGKLASKGQGEAATLKTMAETWRTLNGNPDSISISFGARNLSLDQPALAPVIDCPVLAPDFSTTPPIP